MNLERAISCLEGINSNRFLSRQEITNYINAFIVDNNITDIDLGVMFNFSLDNSFYASYLPSENIIRINLSDIIVDFMKNHLDIKYRKMFFNKVKDPNSLIEKYNLSNQEILLCNLKIMENINHELFHTTSYFNAIKYANGEECNLNDEIIHNLARCNMVQCIDEIIKEPLYNIKHDIFYEEFLAITHGYNWTYEIIDRLNLNKSNIKLFNADAFSRISNALSELNSKSSNYRNCDYTSRGIVGSYPNNLVELNINYGSHFTPKCLDVFNYPLKKQARILKSELKREDMYLKNMNYSGVVNYLLFKDVSENTSKAKYDYSEFESLLYGLCDKDSKILDMFDGDLSNEILNDNLFRFLDSNKKAKVKN